MYIYKKLEKSIRFETLVTGRPLGKPYKCRPVAKFIVPVWGGGLKLTMQVKVVILACQLM